MNFYADSARLLRKLWILSNDARQSLRRAKKISLTRKVLPLHFAPSQLKPKFKCWHIFAVLWSWFLKTKLIWVIFKSQYSPNQNSRIIWAKFFRNILKLTQQCPIQISISQRTGKGWGRTLMLPLKLKVYKPSVVKLALLSWLCNFAFFANFSITIVIEFASWFWTRPVPNFWWSTFRHLKITKKIQNLSSGK